MENKYQQPSRYNSFIKNCTEQCKREMLYKDPLNLNSERKYHKASTVEIKHYDPEVDTIPEKFLKAPTWGVHLADDLEEAFMGLGWQFSTLVSEDPEFIYSDHLDKIEIYVTRRYAYAGNKMLFKMVLKVNETVYGEGGYRSTDYYELTLGIDALAEFKALSIIANEVK